MILVFNLIVNVNVYNPFFNGAGLPSLITPGAIAPNTDRDSQNLDFQLFVVAVNPGILVYDCNVGQWTKNIGNLTSNDVLNAPVVHEDWFKHDNKFFRPLG
jgi:hypothetical protein